MAKLGEELLLREELSCRSPVLRRLVKGQPPLRASGAAGASSTVGTSRAETDALLFCSAANRDWDFIRPLQDETKAVEASRHRGLQKTHVISL